VMNGFRKEVQDRMLSVIAHVEVMAADGNALPDWHDTIAKIRAVPEAGAQVLGAAPFVTSQALLARGDDMRGVIVRGISPNDEATVTEIAAKLKATVLARLVPGNWGVVLGIELARSLGVREGDKVTLLLPGGQVTPAGVVPRMRQLTVAGTFNAGHYEYDSTLALVHVEDAAKLFRVEGPTGVQLRLKNVNDAREIGGTLQAALGQPYSVRDWTRTNANWYDAVLLEKRMMFIILTLIVAVAAFNLVSTLVMTVTDKQADIAILRTLGASPRSVMSVFMVQGALSGVIGTVSGVLLGLLIAFNVGSLVAMLEMLFRVSFLPASIYVINHMPSDPQSADIIPIVVISLLLSFVATLYPSWRASRVQPAEALRYE
jgi:lipoprotein-releasing system permease protein